MTGERRKTQGRLTCLDFYNGTVFVGLENGKDRYRDWYVCTLYFAKKHLTPIFNRWIEVTAKYVETSREWHICAVRVVRRKK